MANDVVCKKKKKREREITVTVSGRNRHCSLSSSIVNPSSRELEGEQGSLGFSEPDAVQVGATTQRPQTIQLPCSWPGDIRLLFCFNQDRADIDVFADPNL